MTVELHVAELVNAEKVNAAVAGDGQQRREELARLATVWECQSCQADVEPDTAGLDGYRPRKGGLCPDCEYTRHEEAQQRVAAEDMASTNGILARLNARAEER
ncbi:MULTISPECIES: hypothetical protein [unclassified Streptomyces]|uniref:hypothetical protein n=1 Tax=unclassified Streptomyces TaxID=2593676 RepID=UPI0036573C18